MRLQKIFQSTWAILKYFYEEGSMPPMPFTIEPRAAHWITREGTLQARWFQRLKDLVEIRLRYFRDYVVEDQVQGISLLRQFWQSGWTGRTAVLFILLSALLGPLFALGSPGAGQPSLAPLVVGLVGIALAWSYGMAAAVRLPLWGMLILCAYLAWYGLIIGAGLAGRPWLALPTLWMLLAAWLKARAEPGRTRLLWLFLFCQGTSYLTYGAFGLFKAFGESLFVPGVLFLGCLYFALLANPLALPQHRAARAPRPGFIFAVTLLIVSLFFGLAALQKPQDLAGYTLLSMRSLLGIVDIFWMWLGATMLEWALGLGTWVSEETAGLLGEKCVRRLTPLLWAGFAYFGWLAVYPQVPQASLFLKQVGIMDWVFSWSDPQFFTVQAGVILTLIILLLWFVLAIRKSLTLANLGHLNGIWLALLAALLTFYESMQGFATFESDTLPPESWWLGVLLLVGILWEMTISTAYYWSSDSPVRIHALGAFLIAMLSIAVITLGAGQADLTQEYTLYSFNGIIYLGLPVALYVAVRDNSSYQPVEKIRLMALFGLGALSAFPLLAFNPYAGLHLAMAPVLWALLLLGPGRKLGRMESWQDGAFAGGALALGFAAFWMSPEVIPLPFASFFQALQDRYLTLDLQRPYLLAGHLWLNLAALTAGLLLGISFYNMKKIAWKILAVLICSAGFGLAFLFLPGFSPIPLTLP